MCEMAHLTSRNVGLPFRSTGRPMGGISASRSANMSWNSKNLKLPFISIGRSTGGVDLPLDLPNMSSQTFYHAHHRGLFALHKTNKITKAEKNPEDP